MPKVSKKDHLQPLQEVPMAVDMEAGVESAEALPDKPEFAPLSASDAGKKIEFRRVRRTHANPCWTQPHARVPPLSHQVPRDHATTRTAQRMPLAPFPHPCCSTQVPVPQHRMTPLKTHWMEMYKPITDNLKLDMRMNLKTKKVRTGAWLYALCCCASCKYSATWKSLVQPTLVLCLQQVEIKTTPQTPNPDVLQKAADFVHAFLLGE